MSEDENKAIQRGLAEEIFNRHDPDAAKRFFAPDYVEHVPLPGQEPGVEGLERVLAEVFFPAFPDQHWTIEEQIAEGDKVLTHFTWRGTHRGEFAGIPPTNGRVEVWGMALDRMANGKVVESRILMDQMGMLQQMGFMPPPGRSEEASPPSG
jgi:steroid delta-isomerase-like uncharacterized protein